MKLKMTKEKIPMKFLPDIEYLKIKDEEGFCFGIDLEDEKKIKHVVEAVNNYDRLKTREKMLEKSIEHYRKENDMLKREYIPIAREEESEK